MRQLLVPIGAIDVILAKKRGARWRKHGWIGHLWDRISFLIVSGHRVVASGTARYQRITLRSGRTGTDGQVTLRLTLCTDSTLSNARINALVRDARLVIGTFCVTLTFTPHAVRKGISGVSRRAGTDRSFLVATIVARRADGIRSARVRIAQVLLRERPAANERIAGHVPRAAAHRSHTAQVTVRTDTARTLARVLADSVDARGTTRRTVPITVTLRPTLGERTADVALRTLAHGPMVGNAGTGCPLAALVTSADTLELAAELVRDAFRIRFALVPATRKWRTDVTRKAGAGWNAVNYVAFGV